MYRHFKRISITEYLEEHFETGGRTRPTIINDLKKGRLQGELIGGKWYVFVDHYNNPIYYPVKGHGRQSSPLSTGNKIADAILAKRSA